MSGEELLREKLRQYAPLRQRMDSASATFSSSPSLEVHQKKLIDLTKYYEETTMMMSNLSPRNDYGHGYTRNAQNSYTRREALDQRDEAPVQKEKQHHEGSRREEKPWDVGFRESVFEQALSSASISETLESGKSKYEQALDRLAQIRHRTTTTTSTSTSEKTETVDTAPGTTLLARKTREPKSSFLLGDNSGSKHERLVQKSIVNRKSTLALSGDTLSVPTFSVTKSSTTSVKSSHSDQLEEEGTPSDQDQSSRTENPGRLFIDTSIVSSDLEKGGNNSQKNHKDFMSAFSYEFKKKPDPEEQSDIIHIDDILENKPYGRERPIMNNSSSDENTSTGSALLEEMIPISIKLRRKTGAREPDGKVLGPFRNRATTPIIVEEEYDDDGDLLSADSLPLDKIQSSLVLKSSAATPWSWQHPGTVDAEADYLAIQQNKQRMERNTPSITPNSKTKNKEQVENEVSGTFPDIIVDAEDDYKKILERGPKETKGPPLIGKLKMTDSSSRIAHVHFQPAENDLNNDEEVISNYEKSPSVNQHNGQVLKSFYYVEERGVNDSGGEKQMLVVEEVTEESKAFSPMSQLQQRLSAKHFMTMRKGKRDFSKIKYPEQTEPNGLSPRTSQETKTDSRNFLNPSTHLYDETSKPSEASTRQKSSSLLSKVTTFNSAKKSGGFINGPRISLESVEARGGSNRELKVEQKSSGSSSVIETKAQSIQEKKTSTVKEEVDSLKNDDSSFGQINTQTPAQFDEALEKSKKSDDYNNDDEKRSHSNQCDNLCEMELKKDSFMTLDTSHAHFLQEVPKPHTDNDSTFSSSNHNTVQPHSITVACEGDEHLAQVSSQEGFNGMNSVTRHLVVEELRDTNSESIGTSFHEQAPETDGKELDKSSVPIIIQGREYPGVSDKQNSNIFVGISGRSLNITPNGTVEASLNEIEVDRLSEPKREESNADTDHDSQITSDNETGTLTCNEPEMADEQMCKKTIESKCQMSKELGEAISAEERVKIFKNDIEVSTSEDNSTDTEHTEDKMFVVYSESLASDMDTAESERYDACAFPFALRILDSTCAWLESDELCKSKSLLRKVKKKSRRKFQMRNGVKSMNALTPKSVYVSSRLQQKTNTFQDDFSCQANNLSPGSQSSKTPTMSNISKRSFTSNMLRCGRQANGNKAKPRDHDTLSSTFTPGQLHSQNRAVSPIELSLAKKGHAGLKGLEDLSKEATDSNEENLKLDSSVMLKIKEVSSSREDDMNTNDTGSFDEKAKSSSCDDDNHENEPRATFSTARDELPGGQENIKMPENLIGVNLNLQNPPNQDLFDSDSTALPLVSSDSSGLSSLEVEQRLAAVDLADKLRQRAATLKRRRKIREKQRQLRADKSDNARRNVVSTAF